MIDRVSPYSSLVRQLDLFMDNKRNALLAPSIPVSGKNPIEINQQFKKKIIFYDDLKRYSHQLSTQTQYEVASIAQAISILVISPFSLFGELYRVCDQSISISACLINVCMIPQSMISSIFKIGFYILRTADEVLSLAATGVGLLAWHAGEKIDSLITASSDTILSNKPHIRKIVYHAIGLTLLAGAALFIPIAPVQMVALPIILGSIYGTLNNQFTVRECPEYYTMGHYYDGTDLRGHAIKSNNLLIKPIVTGCYATTIVTKFAGIILAAVGTIPYTRATLSVHLAGKMVAGVCDLAFIVAHIFSTLKKYFLQEMLNDYAALIGIEWNEANRNTTWANLEKIRTRHIERKRAQLAYNPSELELFNRKLNQLTKAIESNILDTAMPVKYIVGWQANNIRNSVGYLFAGGGTLAIAVTTIFLRIHSL